MVPFSYHSYEPLSGHRLQHDPISSLISPRPIGWISSISSSGHVNLAPYSFFNIFNYKPPILGFASVGWKDTVANASENGEFVWNLPTMSLLEQVNMSSIEVDHHVDEFELAGVTPLPSTHVRPPRVAEALASLECVVTDIRPLRTAAGVESDTWLVLGEAVCVHIREDALDAEALAPASVMPLLRGGGPGDYFTVRDDDKVVLMRPPRPASLER